MSKIYIIIISVGCFIAGLIAGSILLSAYIATEAKFSTADASVLSSILLSCVSIILTFFGIIIAIIAIFGFSYIKDGVENTAKLEISKSVSDGLLKSHMHFIAEQETQGSLQPGGTLYDQAINVIEQIATKIISEIAPITIAQQAIPIISQHTDRLFRESAYRGIGLDESSGILDPREEDP